MLFKIKRSYGIISLLLIVIVAGFCIYNARRSAVKEEVTGPTNPIRQEKEVAKFELKAKPPEFLEKLDAVAGVTLRQGDIHIQGQPNVLKPEGAPLGTPQARTPAKIPDRGYHSVGVSITNTSGKIIPSSWDGNQPESGQNQMIVVENMGRPQGVDFRPQPVTAMAQQGLESEELNILEQKRRKRKSNFAKSLEKREARRSLYKRN
ncbi:hypothetical protein D1BOALGB6SA_2226 [Olavius sp. associated proteobacterium Delta 1]|nr:hypothetical protein D1BOALGB6SA_2226 [Olavius sp. associated proteobacterium Delta 1]